MTSPEIFYIRHNPSTDLDKFIAVAKRCMSRRGNLPHQRTFRLMEYQFHVKYPLLEILPTQKSVWEYLQMARVNWRFVNIKLTKADLPALESFVQRYDNDPENVLQELHSAGYKVSSAFVHDKSAFVVTISGSDASKHNGGCSMSSWSDDYWQAVIMCGYKHFVIAKAGDWDDHDTAKENWG